MKHLYDYSIWVLVMFLSATATVTAAAPSIPPPLIDQLKSGGRIVIPIGKPYGSQILSVVNKNERGEISVEDLLPVAFVPLTGDHNEK